jgi:Na+-transporting NADH:ubiquinone oxidoreductase subunit C
MARKDSAIYTLFFAAFVCTVCGLFVSASAVYLREDQEANKKLDMQRNVLLAAGLIAADEPADPDTISQLFKERVKAEIITLASGEPAPDVDAASFDQRLASTDPKTSQAAPENRAKVARLPRHARVFKITDGARTDMLILPVEGKGLWSTLYGFLALDGADPRTVRGIAFYEHGETPGLGGEVDNPKWRALWKGREALDEDFNPVLTVIKGKAGSAEDDPRRVDGLSGATMTSNGVSALVRFWLGEHGFGPYLRRFAEKGGR